MIFLCLCYDSTRKVGLPRPSGDCLGLPRTSYDFDITFTMILQGKFAFLGLPGASLDFLRLPKIFL